MWQGIQEELVKAYQNVKFISSKVKCTLWEQMKVCAKFLLALSRCCFKIFIDIQQALIFLLQRNLKSHGIRTVGESTAVSIDKVTCLRINSAFWLYITC